MSVLRRVMWLVLVTAALMPTPKAWAQKRIDCAQIVSAMSRSVAGSTSGKQQDFSEIAEKLGTSVAWAEHCLQIYGRRPRHPGLESAEGREERLEALEDYEPEESTEPEDPGELSVRRDRSKEPKLTQDKKDDPNARGD